MGAGCSEVSAQSPSNQTDPAQQAPDAGAQQERLADPTQTQEEPGQQILKTTTKIDTTKIHKIQLEVPSLIVGGVPFSITVNAKNSEDLPTVISIKDINFSVENGEITYDEDSISSTMGTLTVGKVSVKEDSFTLGSVTIQASTERHTAQNKPFYLPEVAKLLPSIFAILLALITREVLLSLFLGVWLGTTLLGGGDPIPGLLASITNLVQALADYDHASVIIFTVMIGGLVSLIAKSGGTQGLVTTLRRVARGPRSGQFATAGLGTAIFFDDYASLLLTGPTMRPITDRLRISREKLSFLVDSTAAPVANIALISTWVGYEISLISSGFEGIGVTNVNALNIFVASIPYRFYPLFMLAFIFLNSYFLRDFGPMYRAELRTRRSGRVLRKGATPTSYADTTSSSDSQITGRWWNAVVPIFVMIASVTLGLYIDGRNTLLAEQSSKVIEAGFHHTEFLPDTGLARLWALLTELGTIFGKADSFQVLIVASLLGVLTAGLLAMGQRILTLRQTVETWTQGARHMTYALVILVMAWSLAAVTDQLHVASYLASLSSGGNAIWIPVMMFIIAAGTSFATGTAWGTMAILMPVSIQLVAQLAGTDPQSPVMLAAIGAILGGATVGDHISPISDTTIMSSMSCAADLVDHVRTQLPYALTVSMASILVGYLPIALGVPVALSLLGGVVALGLFLVIFGKSTHPNSVMALIRKDLASEDRSVRLEALEDLSGMGGSPLASEVVHLLKDSDERVRIQALQALGTMRHRDARQAVEACLDSENQHIRATAVKAISQLGGERVVPLIIARLEDEDPRVRSNALEGLGYVEGGLDEATIKVLYNATLDKDHRVQATAAMVLWKQSREDEHLTQLVNMLREGTTKAALSAVYALSQIDNKLAAKLLREAVTENVPEVQNAAAKILQSRDEESD